MGKNRYNKDNMLKEYIKLCYRLNKIATRQDIDNCECLPCSDTFKRKFGSMTNLKKAADVIGDNELSGKPLKKEVEKALMKKRIYKGRRLDYMEVRVDPDLPPLDYIRKIYDNKSLGEIWTEIESKIPKGIADYLKIDM